MLVVETRPLGLAGTVRGFRGVRALVLGDALLDVYYEGHANRICREAPVPVVARTDEVAAPGGAANCAANLAAMGADVTFLSVVGRDAPARVLRAGLQSLHVDDSCLIEDESISTLQKLRIVADGQYVVRFDSGSAFEPAPAVRRHLLDLLQHELDRCDVVIVSDYSYGAITDEMRERLAGHQIPLVVDAKDLRRYAPIRPALVTPNQAEAEQLAQRAEAVCSTLEALGQHTREAAGAEYAAVTLAGDGVLLAGDGETVRVAAHRVGQAHDIGAGDSFTAASALALAVGAAPHDAVRIAVEAACIAVTKQRTALVQHHELLQRVSVAAAGAPSDLGELQEALDQERRHGRKIVFTSGVFDILHAGHVHFLRQAGTLGDVLVVGINSDSSARRLKGPNRPINGERDRQTLVAALDSVDHAVIFDEDTPEAMILALRPHIHVKGGDYAGETLPEAAAAEEAGSRVVILPLYQSESTTRVIERIVSRSGHA